MATLDSEPEPTPSTSPTPPPIPTSPHHHTNGIANNPNRVGSYRRPSKRNSFNNIKNIQSIYDSTNNKKHTGKLIHGQPTKESRLLEYFLVISYGESLKIRKRSPLMDIFENFQKRIHHHHAYIVHPGMQQSGQRRRSSKHRKSKSKRKSKKS